MKKFISIMMAAVMMLSLAACGESKGNSAALDVDALGVLETVWGTYADDEKFPAAGGDMANSVMDGAGVFDTADVESLDAMLGVPASSAENIDNAASLMHMMNANTFTCGSYQLKEGADLETFTTALKDSIMNRQWMCGFPDTLIVVTLSDSHVVAAFGNAELIENFKTKLAASYESAEVIIEESLV